MPPLNLVSSPLQIASGANNACAVTPAPVAPEFLVSLNTCTPPGTPQPQLPETNKTIEAILQQVLQRLSGPLDPIWDGPDGHHAYWQPRAACSAEENDRIQAEEEWARWCTELQSGTVYGTATGYGPKMTDVFFYKAFHDTNPVVPVRMACQQLCTYAYYSRGLGFDEVKGGGSYGVTAGPNGYLGKLFEGDKWDSNGKYANIPDAYARPAGPMSAGTILGFLPPPQPGDDPKKPKQRPGSHVAYVLRSAPSVSSAQFFDTGALFHSGGRTKDAAASAANPAFEGCNYDNRLFDGTVAVVRPQPTPCVGIGVLKALSPAKMRAGIANARRARPLGLVRLAIFRRPAPGATVKDEDILYVSPRLLMHDVASNANYYGSRFLWALRATPGYEKLEVMLQFSHPKHELADRMRAAGRGDSLATTWKPGGQHDVYLYASNDDRGRTRMRARVTLKVITDPKTKKDIQTFPTQGSVASYPAVIARFSKLDENKDEWTLKPAGTPPTYFAPW